MYSLGLFTGDGSLMGMLVAELQSLSDLEAELGPLLHKPSPHSTVMYVLSLGMLRMTVVMYHVRILSLECLPKSTAIGNNMIFMVKSAMPTCTCTILNFLQVSIVIIVQ